MQANCKVWAIYLGNPKTISLKHFCALQQCFVIGILQYISLLMLVAIDVKTDWLNPPLLGPLCLEPY